MITLFGLLLFALVFERFLPMLAIKWPRPLVRSTLTHDLMYDPTYYDSLQYWAKHLSPLHNTPQDYVLSKVAGVGLPCESIVQSQPTADSRKKNDVYLLFLWLLSQQVLHNSILDLWLSV